MLSGAGAFGKQRTVAKRSRTRVNCSHARFRRGGPGRFVVGSAGGRGMALRGCDRWKPLTRRHCLRALTGATLAARCPWLPAVAAAKASTARRCLVLWMAGGPSQIDTFDPKSGHENGGPFAAIATRLPGVAFSEHLPELAKRAGSLTLIRSMQTREGDHARATFTMHTGRRPAGSIDPPVLGSVLAGRLAVRPDGLPAFVSITPPGVLAREMIDPGFLGPQYAPLVVDTGNAAAGGAESGTLRVENLDRPGGVTAEQWERRRRLWSQLQAGFAERHGATAVEAHAAAYRAAMRLMQSQARRAFRLDEEPDAVRQRYGRNTFGEGCLLARRLLERGVGFVEVAMNGLAPQDVLGWDTHQQNFRRLPELCGALDRAFAALIDDLRACGLWNETLIVWAGEFGRTPKVNATAGRDHYPAAWTVVLSGGLVRTGSVVGRTSADGGTVVERPVSASQLLATIYRALNVDPHTELLAPIGRPVPLVERDVKPLEELVQQHG
ncbi:MAG: DUF1501 domain-containing protein [Planctomycetota bacterium]|nr:MAG: DUF1501 domain-containing protein [Planctomycetota bacterium]